MINVAFLREVKEANSEVWEVLQQLRRYCDDADDPMAYNFLNGDSLGRTLQKLRDLLATQFDLEETFGFLSCPDSDHQRLHQQAADALAGHRWLYLSLVELSERVDDYEYRGTLRSNLLEVLTELSSFLRNLEAHENLELELIRVSDSLLTKQCK